MKILHAEPSCSPSVLEKLKAETAELDIEQARHDPNTFMEFVFADKDGYHFKQQRFHEEWQDAMCNYQRIMILASQEHGKTEQVLGHALWCIGRNTNLRVKYICNADEEAVKRVTASRQHIDHNKRFKLVFPHVRQAKDDKLPWAAHKLFVQRDFISKDPTLEGKGVLASGAGGRADVLIFDDPVDIRNTLMNPALIPKVIEQHDNVWDNLCEPDAQRIYICTPWVLNDLTHVLKERHSYKVLIYFAGREDDGSLSEDRHRPLWPAKWGKKENKQKERDIGTRGYERAWRGVPLSQEDALLSNIDTCINYAEGLEIVRPNWRRYTGVDLARSKKGSASRTVFFTLAISQAPRPVRRIPIDIEIGRWTPKETIERFFAHYKRHNPDVVMVENNAYQEAFLEWAQEYAGRKEAVILPLKAFTTGKNKFDPEIGLPSLAVEIDNKSWEILLGKKHDLTCDCSFCIWRHEMKNWPIAAHDDTVMASWFAREASKIKRTRTTAKSRGKRSTFTELKDF